MLSSKKQLKRNLLIIIVCLLLAIPLLQNVSGGKTFFINRFAEEKADSYKNIQTVGITGQNIIISPPQFYSAANELKEFHNMRGISTVVINTTWIFTNYDESPDPPYKGYAKRIIPRLFIREYDFSLAKKIINFLRDTSLHPNLEYVTLFGNGAFVPPSYYIHSPGRVLKNILLFFKFPDFYNNIVATDFFYISPDYDLLPDYKVGRLPVSNENEALDLVNKIKDWRENVDWEWFKNIYVAGDQPNHPEEISLKGCYAGEMIAVDAINREYFQEMSITKLFWTEGKFNKQSIMDALEQGNSGIMYMMTHGTVDRWGAHAYDIAEFINADDLMSFPENKNVPIIVSVACMSGAFDTDLAKRYNVQRGATSFGEAVLLSKGAGIAYIGTTRATLGSPLLYLDEGELVITKERGIAGMLTYFFEAYHNGTNILGDIVNKAIEKYVSINSFPLRPEKDEDFIVLASFVLLGDPALDIPIFVVDIGGQSYEQPHITAINPEGYTSEEYSRPWYYTDSEITLRIETDSPEVYVKRINIDKDEVVDRQDFYPEENTFFYTFSSDEATEYLIRASSLDGKESWFYLTIVRQDSFS